MDRKKADFQFKEFGIRQEQCGMKVGTDGVLLGAWAWGGRRILDIGTGTGLIALMMAQRFGTAQVDAIDVDEDACRQASENIAASPFADRVSVACARLQDYNVGDALYDAIVSNPPFFLETLKSPDPQRAMARHADSLPFADLFAGVARLLSETGVFSVVVPVEAAESLMFEAVLKRFPGTPVFRQDGGAQAAQTFAPYLCTASCHRGHGRCHPTASDPYGRTLPVVWRTDSGVLRKVGEVLRRFFFGGS